MIIKNFIDENIYKHITLENKIKVVLVSNKEIKKSSCALSVNVGSFNDPPEFQGLAHFLEHMLFMGTEKYPSENGFNEFLSQHGGYTNAYTMDEMTLYYCDADSNQLRNMADMFSSFFSCPLFLKDSVNREINAVNSEYLNSLNSKDFRIKALLSEFTEKNDLRGRFSCGNTETLNHDGIWDILVKFWMEYYSADGMCLAICGNNSIEELEEIAMLFSDIPNRNYYEKLALPKSDNFCYFDPKFYGSIVQMAPLDDKKELIVCINIPPKLKYYESNPLSFIDFLLTKKENDSLLSKYKNENLAFGISLGLEHFRDSTLIWFDIELTEKGSREYLKVLDMLFYYIKNLPVEKYEYLRLKRIQEEEFKYLLRVPLILQNVLLSLCRDMP